MRDENLKRFLKAKKGFFAIDFHQFSINFQIVEQLIERPEIELDNVNTHKHVPLHLSAQNGHLELSRILAQAGSNLESQDLIGENNT